MIFPRFLFTICLVLGGCQKMTKVAETQVQSSFKLEVSNFFERYWEVRPAVARRAGNRSYDGILRVPDKKMRQQVLSFAEKFKVRFQNITNSQLTPLQIADKKLLLNHLNSIVWRINIFKDYQWNPSLYNVGYSIGSVLEGKDKSLEDKLRDVSDQLKMVPAYYSAAKFQVQRPTKEYTSFGLKQNRGTIQFLDSKLRGKIKSSNLKLTEKKRFMGRLDSAKKAIESYVNYLEKIIKNPKIVGGFRSFRLSSKIYNQKFAFDIQSHFTAKQVYENALLEKSKTHKKMIPLAKQLWQKYLPNANQPKNALKLIQTVIGKVSENHTQPDQFVESVRQQIPQLEKFVRQKNLLELDPDRPLKVRETPSYMRGFAGASIDAPGFFEKERETYYNVTPLDAMSSSAKLSYLREYNDYTLQILNIHEAVPGHYAQLVYSNKSPSMVKSLLGNGAMVEGWAVYSERMMLEEGYGQNKPELWLMYYKWYLRVVTNMILDYEIHNSNLSRQQAMKYMMEDAFQEKAEAEGKWHRATVSQVQLTSYFSGFSEIYELREKLKSRDGGNFNLKRFHEKLLSYGSSPVGVIRQFMLE